MKKNIIKLLAIISIVFCSMEVYSQDSSADSTKKSQTKVKHTFENAVLINNQTVECVPKNTLDFMLQHRFGVIENLSDLGGIYGPANIRIGLDYGITKRLSAGVGATKSKHYYDLEWKYALMQQKTNGGFPVSITYYGDFAISTDSKDKYLNQDSVYALKNKFSYFHEIMIARKFNKKISMQIGGTYSHFNIVDSVLSQHDFYGASFIGRYKFSPQSSIHLEFDYPLNVSGIPESNRPLPNLGVGFEVATSGHQFQIFVCTANGIINQETRVYNLNDFTKKEIMIGFNITRQWGF